MWADTLLHSRYSANPAPRPVPRFPPRLARLPTARLLPRHNLNTRKQIVRTHNTLRAAVTPPAADMLRMVTHRSGETETRLQ